MSAGESTIDFEPVIWARLMQTPRAPISPEVARYLLSIDFSETDNARMQELMDKSNEGALTPDETSELNGYVKIANVLSVMHSQARVALRELGFDRHGDPQNS